jgi:subtilisin family serine protease
MGTVPLGTIGWLRALAHRPCAADTPGVSPTPRSRARLAGAAVALAAVLAALGPTGPVPATLGARPAPLRIPAASVLAAAGGRLAVVREDARGHRRVTVVVASPGSERAAALAIAAADPAVVAVLPDVRLAVSGWPADGLPDDPGATRQWGFDAIDAWDALRLTGGDPGAARIAVLDTGAALGHPDLAGLDLAGTRNEVATLPGGAANPAYRTADVNDGHGHGTHVLGTLAATADNGVGVVGMAPGVSMLVVKVMGDDGTGTFTWMCNGIAWAVDHGATVITMSLGANLAPEVAATLSWCTTDAIGAGVTVVAAAGNAGTTALSYPASNPGVISVGSAGPGPVASSFSQHNAEVDVSAPGELVHSTLRDGGYGAMSGTSMATPHVAGIVALVQSAQPGIAPDEVLSILASTALDAGPAGRDDWFGAGLVQAEAAVRAAGGGDPTPAPAPDPTPAPTPDPTPAPSAAPTPAPAERPVVIARTPGSGATGADRDANARIVFSTPIDVPSGAAVRITVARTGASVRARIRVVGDRLVLDPAERLRARTRYRITVTVAVRSILGAPAQATSWTFRTGRR